MEHGADVLALDDDGHKPLDVARSSDVVDYLRAIEGDLRSFKRAQVDDIDDRGRDDDDDDDMEEVEEEEEV